MEFALPEDFEDLFKSLKSNNVKYLLTGEYAVVVHGYVRNTNDLDIVVGNDAENLKLFLRALEDFGFSTEELAVDELTETRQVIRMGTEPLRIEVMNYLEGCDFEAAYSRRMEVTLQDVTINVISLPDLIRNKEAVGRLQDLTDVEQLKRRN